MIITYPRISELNPGSLNIDFCELETLIKQIQNFS